MTGRFLGGLIFATFAAGLTLHAQTSINFENLGDGVAVTNQYSGLTFSNAQALTAGFSLNDLDFPAHSGQNAITDTAGPISITFSTAISAFSGYFTHAQPITLTAFNAAGSQVAATTSSTNNAAISGNGSPNQLLSLTASNIAKVVITGAPSGNSLVADDLSYTIGSPPVSALQLITVTPCRVMDTRNPNGPLGGPFIAGGGMPRSIPVPSSPCGIPANAAAYSLNITVVPRKGTLGYLTVWPTGQQQPVVSTLNSIDGSILANAAIVPAGTSGAISVYATDDTDLIVDINGYFAPPATNTFQFYPLFPCRVLDTRNPNGPLGGPTLAANAIRSFPIPSANACGAPANAAAYSLNVTVVPQGTLGYLTAWPTGQMQPGVSTLNSLDGTILANAAIVPAGTGGAVSFFATNNTDLIVDINGYFAAPASSGLNFYTATPCRLVDTRSPNGNLGSPTMGANTTRSFPLSTSSCAGLPGYPANQVYSLNMTVVPQGPLGYLTTWPTGGAQPVVSTLNAPKGLVVANMAIVPASTSSSISVFVTNTTDVIIDTNGYFGP